MAAAAAGTGAGLTPRSQDVGMGTMSGRGDAVPKVVPAKNATASLAFPAVVSGCTVLGFAGGEAPC